MTDNNPPAPPANDPPAPPPAPPANDPPAPPPAPPANDPPKPPDGDRLSTVEKAIETLTALVTKLIPEEDKKPTKKPWIYWGSKS